MKGELQSGRIRFGGGILLLLLGTCIVTLPWTLGSSSNFYYDRQHTDSPLLAPRMDTVWTWFGTSKLGQSLMGQCLLGGVISLTIGLAAAAISVVLGVSVGILAGYRGGWLDSLLMRIVDVLYALPYILLVILFKIALESPLGKILRSSAAANLVVLFLSIGLVSWLTMARVIRGQVLSLRTLPFIEAARAAGVPQHRIFLRHLLPALNPVLSRWWLLVFPCTLLGVTLLALNFVGDGLRDAFDPKAEASHI